MVPSMPSPGAAMLVRKEMFQLLYSTDEGKSRKNGQAKYIDSGHALAHGVAVCVFIWKYCLSVQYINT